ncbi:adenylyl-sulfate kinase [Vibrio chagasii]|nr:adenylyl-sulfate kinase [Vibrio chagasii]
MKIKHFTGIDSEYQAPVSPEIHLKTENPALKAVLTML